MVRIDVLSARGAWDELEKLAKSRKSPIGYEPFVEAAVAQGRLDEASK